MNRDKCAIKESAMKEIVAHRFERKSKKIDYCQVLKKQIVINPLVPDVP